MYKIINLQNKKIIADKFENKHLAKDWILRNAFKESIHLKIVREETDGTFNYGKVVS